MKPILCPSWSPGSKHRGVCAEGDDTKKTPTNGGTKPSRGDCILKCKLHDGPWREEALQEMLAPTIKGVPITPGNVVAVGAAGVHAAQSRAKVALGIDAATPEQVAARLATCERCPGFHSTFVRNEPVAPTEPGGKWTAKAVYTLPTTESERDAVLADKRWRVFSCGPMMASITVKLKPGEKAPCGCILREKAKDLKEDCPMLYWPRIQKEGR